MTKKTVDTKSYKFIAKTTIYVSGHNKPFYW